MQHNPSTKWVAFGPCLPRIDAANTLTSIKRLCNGTLSLHHVTYLIYSVEQWPCSELIVHLAVCQFNSYHPGSFMLRVMSTRTRPVKFYCPCLAANHPQPLGLRSSSQSARTMPLTLKLHRIMMHKCERPYIHLQLQSVRQKDKKRDLYW